jgi:hypothetical protein
VAFLRGFLRVYSWIFETIISLIAIAAAVAEIAFAGDVHLGWLPWEGNTLLAWLIVGGLLGLLFVILAIRGKMRVLLFLFSIGVFVLLVKGLFMGPYAFDGPGPAQRAALLVAGALLAIVGAWPMAEKRR